MFSRWCRGRPVQPAGSQADQGSGSGRPPPQGGSQGPRGSRAPVPRLSWAAAPCAARGIPSPPFLPLTLSLLMRSSHPKVCLQGRGGGWTVQRGPPPHPPPAVWPRHVSQIWGNTRAGWRGIRGVRWSAKVSAALITVGETEAPRGQATSLGAEKRGPREHRPALPSLRPHVPSKSPPLTARARKAEGPVDAVSSQTEAGRPERHPPPGTRSIVFWPLPRPREGSPGKQPNGGRRDRLALCPLFPVMVKLQKTGLLVVPRIDR